MNVHVCVYVGRGLDSAWAGRRREGRSTSQWWRSLSSDWLLLSTSRTWLWTRRRFVHL